MSIKDKVALVTGGASGIGLAICKQFLKEGAKGIAIGDIDTAGGKKTEEELENEFGKDRAVFLKTDVTKQEEFEEAFKSTIKKFSAIDILVNNAGIFDDLNWELQVNINLKGVIRGILLAYDYMGKNKCGNGGTVINMASLAAVSPGLGIPIYSGLKSAVIGLTHAFGHPFYLKDTGVRMMAMCPGVTRSSIAVLEEAPRFLVPEWKAEVEKYYNEDSSQSAENVAQGVVHMIKEGKHGSIWASLDEKPAQELFIPDWEKLKTK